MMADVPMRLVVAYGLIALLILVGAATVWWLIHQSHARVEARRQARRRDAGRQPSDGF